MTDDPDQGEYADPGRPFLSVSPCFGHGRLWLYVDELDVLVSVDPDALSPRIHAALGAPPPSASDDPFAGGGTALLMTTDSVWVARDGLLVAVDPHSGAQSSVPVPSGPRWWTTDGERLWATAWPAADVLEVDPAAGSQRTGTVGGHLTEACASAGMLWVVDRTDETLLGLDLSTLRPHVRVPFDGGRLHLTPWHGGVLAARSEEFGTVAVGVGVVDTTSLWWVQVGGDRQRILQGGAGYPTTLVGDAIWLTATREPPLQDRRETPGRVGVASPTSMLSVIEDWPDPVTALQEIALPGAEPGRRVVLSGQVLRTAPADGRFWTQGFVRSRQESPISLIDPDRGLVGEVDLESLDLSSRAPTRSPAPRSAAEPETPDETLERLPAAVRDGLTRSGWRTDERTGERSETPWLDSRFRLVDVTVEAETFDVLVTFTWSDDPGRTFGYVYGADPGWSSTDTAMDLETELMEDLDTGIMRWGARDESDGVIWVSRPADAEEADGDG